jgi:hypothetical protein
MFQVPFELKLIWDFLGINILPREEPGEEEVNEMGPRGQTKHGGAALGQAAPPMPVWALNLRFRPSLFPDAQLDLKMPI